MSAQRSQSDTLQDDYVRTGEAVSLDVTPASPMERFAAAVFDATVYMGSAFLLLALTARSWGTMSYSSLRVFFIAVIASVTFFVPFAIEIATRGRSLGKWALNLRVVRDDGGPLAGGLAFAAEMLNAKGKRLGDLAAGTMVCSQGASVFYPPLIMPPGLEQWGGNRDDSAPRRCTRRRGARLPRDEQGPQPGSEGTGRHFPRGPLVRARPDSTA